MDDVSARVINDAVFEQEAAAPDAECANGVGEGEPQRHEDHPRGEVHAAEERASDKNERDCREGELEIDHRSLRKRLGEIGGWKIGIFELETQINGDGRVADQRQHLSTEGHLIAPYAPTYHHTCKGVECHEG